MCADLIRDNKVDVLNVSESWVHEDAPDAIKHDLAHPNYSVMQIYRPIIDGSCGGLAFIYSNKLGARPLKTSSPHTSLKLQLVRIQVGKLSSR